MSADIDVLPPLGEINERLTRLERERFELETMRRLHARRRRWAEQDHSHYREPHRQERERCAAMA